MVSLNHQIGRGNPSESRVQMLPKEKQKTHEQPLIESFNGRLRDECLNTEIFRSMAEVRGKLAAWRYDYNHHSTTGRTAP